jgi:small conductance mechanosensitive channel
VQVVAVDDSHVSVQLRAWVDAQAFPRVQSALLEAVLAEFGARGLKVPRPSREVHVFHHGEAMQPVPDDALKPAS